MNKLISFAAATLCFISIGCQRNTIEANYQVIPLPNDIELNADNGSFTLDKATCITYPEADSVMQRNAELLADYLQQATGLNLKISTETPAENAIVLSSSLKSDNDEAYVLCVTPERITIDGASAAGCFYGIQTLRKSIPELGNHNVTFPAATIADAPRFPHRGALLDVCRHYFPVDSVKQFIDILALHNANALHWHISEDQGWRIEIKSRPLLTEIGSVRDSTVIGRTDKFDGQPYGGFYTQEEARDIVKYAAERHITVIPEIDLPGHMLGALAAYPELGCTGGPYRPRCVWGIEEDVLCAGNPETYKFLDDVLGEIAEIFPSKYICIGGDECPKVRWKECPKCQAKIKELGIKAKPGQSAEAQLQSHVMKHAEEFLAQHGRRVIGWDEILEGGLGPDVTILSWRGTNGAREAVRQGHDAILCPYQYCYLDYYQTADVENEPLAIGGCTPLDKTYNFEPVTDDMSAEEAAHVIGVQGNLWTEFISTFPYAKYMFLPRFAAVAEIQWTQPEKKNYEEFCLRLPQLMNIYDAYGYDYAKHVLNVKSERTNADNGVLITLSTMDGAPIYYTTDGSEPSADNGTAYGDSPILVDTTCVVKSVAIRNGKPSDVTKERVAYNKATFKPVTMLTDAVKRYARTPETLVDGILGGGVWKDERWMGYSDNDLVAVIDLQNPATVSSVEFNTNVERARSVFDAVAASVEVSDNGTDFTEVARQDYGTSSSESPECIINHVISFAPVQARYVKITVSPEKNIPAWHPAAGKAGYVFVDEFLID